MADSLAECRRIAASVDRRGIRCLYHFTRIAALPSILRTGGIMCRALLEANGISFVGHGWGRAGKDEEFADYICCGFLPPWGMMHREADPICVVEVSASLISRPGTLFCPDNSAFNHFTLEGLKAASDAASFDAMFPNQTTYKTSSHQAEVLVHRSIPLTDFRVIHFRSDPERKAALAQLHGIRIPASQRAALPLNFKVTPEHFPR